jgi:hypothetical protein
MKRLVTIAMMMLLALNLNAQDVYSVGSYTVNNKTIGALYKNDKKIHWVHTDLNTKATRVTCDSQGNVYWFINYYENPSNTYLYSEIRKNNQIYASTLNHSEVHVSDLYCLNDTLYCTGYQYNEDSVTVATVWKGEDFTTHWIVGDGVHSSLIYSVDIDKRTGIPYFCGYVIDGKKKASVWREQDLLFTNDLDSIYGSYITYSRATRIAVGNGHVYTIGDFEPQDWSDITALWKDNVMIYHGDLYEYDIHEICTFQNSYYRAISYRWGDEILKDGQTQMLNISYAYKLLSTLTDIYVIGKDFDSNFYLWKNFERGKKISNCQSIADACVFDPYFFQNSEWYYEIEWDNGDITYQHLQCTGDTAVGNQRPKIIVRSNTQYDKDGLIEVTHEYVYEENSKVYWWNHDLEEFTVLYDLGAETGDEWEIKVGTESIIVHVDSVGVFEYEGETRKMLHISDAGNIFNGDIVVGYGHMTSFFPEKLMHRDGGYTVDGLRCYWVEDVLLYHNGDEDCDAIYSEIHGVGEDGPSTLSTGSGTEGALMVYPNPANNTLFVETRLIASLPAPTYRITNLMGQTLMSGVLAVRLPQCDSPTIIDVSLLPAGMYFISMGGQTVKFVKQ